MLAYNPYWLEAFAVTRSVERLAREGIITPDQLNIIRAAYANPLYVLRGSERMTLFLFTSIAIAALYFLIAELLPAQNPSGGPMHLLAAGMLCLATLEVLIKFKKTYRAGVDDVALYAGLAFVVSGITKLMNPSSESGSLFTASLIAFPLLVVAAIRYVDRVTAVAAFVCLLSIVFGLCRNVGISGSALLPLVLMSVSGMVFALQRLIRSRRRLAPWLICIDASAVAALLSFYLCGNTFVLQQMLPHNSASYASVAAVMPLSFALTLAIPIAYIVWGLVARNRTMLRVGLLVEVLSLATARYYNPSIALEHALIIVGMTLLLLSVVTIQLLKSKTEGFTFEQTPLQLPGRMPLNAIALCDRWTAQEEAVRAFEAGKSRIGGGASLGW